MKVRRRLRFVLLAVFGALIVAVAIGLAGLKRPFVGARPPMRLPSSVDVSALRRHVSTLVEDMAPRDHAHPQDLDRVAAYVRDALAASGARIREEPFKVGPATYRNVIGSFGPEGGPIVVIGAHYDAATGTPGADDNATGVAALLELGRWLGEMRSLAGRVDLVAFSLEEPPYFGTDLMGSAVHAEGLQRAGTHVKAMISLEMLGYRQTAPGTQRYPAPLLRLAYPGRGDFLAVIGRTADRGLVGAVKGALQGVPGLAVESLAGPAWIPGVDFSDHRNYWARGIPAVMLTDTSFYRNPNYHKPGDTLATLDFEWLAKVTEGVFQSTAALLETVAP